MNIAEKLEHLFADTAGDRGRPATLQEIVNRMTERDIAPMSLSYLQQLRSGQAQNPRMQHLRALADAFDVPVTYFFDDEEIALDEAGPAHELTPDERTIALRVHGLSRDSLDSIRSIIELARRSERLDDPPGDQDEGAS